MKTQGEFSLKYRTDIAELLMYYAVLWIYILTDQGKEVISAR
jgi:hypothetical protein